MKAAGSGLRGGGEHGPLTGFEQTTGANRVAVRGRYAWSSAVLELTCFEVERGKGRKLRPPIRDE